MSKEIETKPKETKFLSYLVEIDAETGMVELSLFNEPPPLSSHSFSHVHVLPLEDALDEISSNFAQVTGEAFPAQDLESVNEFVRTAPVPDFLTGERVTPESCSDDGNEAHSVTLPPFNSPIKEFIFLPLERGEAEEVGF